MAIQVRRGNLADLDTSKLVQGEPFVTLDKDSNNEYYVGVAIAPSNVVRLATQDELVDIRADCEQYRDEAQTSATNAATSESNSEAWAVGERGGVPVSSGDDTYENNSKYYAGLAQDAWNDVDAAVSRVLPTVSIDFTTGMLLIDGTSLYFGIDQTTGNLTFGFTP